MQEKSPEKGMSRLLVENTAREYCRYLICNTSIVYEYGFRISYFVYDISM